MLFRSVSKWPLRVCLKHGPPGPPGDAIAVATGSVHDAVHAQHFMPSGTRSGFSQGYLFQVPLTYQYRTIGGASPPNLALAGAVEFSWNPHRKGCVGSILVTIGPVIVENAHAKWRTGCTLAKE